MPFAVAMRVGRTDSPQQSADASEVWVSQSMAGGSAAAKARDLRAQAARLEEEARQWDKGAEGERRTAAVLSNLAARGYVVLDDLAIPGSKANIDHVVIGPTGVVVVETKSYTGRLNLNDGVLWHGKYPLRKELAAAQFEADKVRAVVASTGWTVTVRSVMCIHGVDVPSDPTASLAPIELCGPLDLLSRVEADQPLLAPAHVSHLATLIEQALPPQRIVSPPVAPPPPTAARAQANVVELRRSGRGRSRRSRTRVPRVLEVADSFTRRAVRLLVGVVAVLVGLALASALLSSAQEYVENLSTTTTSTSTTATTIPPVVAPPAPAP